MLLRWISPPIELVAKAGDAVKTFQSDDGLAAGGQIVAATVKAAIASKQTGVVTQDEIAPDLGTVLGP